MTESVVSRTLYRELLRWARRADGIPLGLRSLDVNIALPPAEYIRARPPSVYATTTAESVSENVKALTRLGFHQGRLLQVCYRESAGLPLCHPEFSFI